MPAAVPYLITAAVSMILSFGASLVSQKLGRRGSDSSGEVSNGHLLTKRNHQERVPRIYGRCRVGVNTAFIGTSGGNNAQLHIIALLGEGVMKGIVRQNGDTYETTGTDFPTSNPPLVYLDGQLWTRFPSAGVPFIEFYDGSSTQTVCTTLQNADGDWQDALRNTAYLYIRLYYDRDKVMVQPNTIQAVADGLECYDPLTTTTVWTNNPAIVAYNYMTTSRFRGGMGIPAAKIDTTALSDFKTYCTTKGWTANIPIFEGKPDSDNLQAILDGGRARIIDSGQTLKTKFYDLNHESTVLALTDEDIVVDDQGAEQLEISQPDIMDRPNTVRVKFLNERGYQYSVDDFVLSDDDAIEDDGGDKRELPVSVHGLSDINLAQKMGYYHLERARYNRTVNGHFGRRCMGLEAMDLITLTFTPFGWSEKYFRVTQHAIQPDYTVKMSLVEEAVSLYNDLYDPEAIALYDTTLYSPFDKPPSVQSVTYSEDAYTERGRSRSRIIVDFEPPPVATAPFWSYAEVWIRRGESGTWEFKTKAGEYDSNSNYTLDPVEEGELYFIKFVSVSVHGQKEDFNAAYTLQHRVVGYDTDPDNISALTAIATGSTVQLSATYTGASDIQAFEIRIGTNWEDGLVVMTAPAHDNELRTSVHGVRPGTLTFWAAARNNARKYSGTPISATVTVFVPAGYTELATYGSWTFRTTNGTFTNTDEYSHTIGGTAYDCLRVVSHYKYPFAPFNWVLSGTWQTRTHDFGAVEKLRVWGDFITDLVTGNEAWEDNFAANLPWEDTMESGTTWESNFDTKTGGKLRAKLLTKDTDSDWGNPDNEYDYFEFQAAEIEARYCRVEVEIIDPNQDTFLYMKELAMKAYEGPA